MRVVLKIASILVASVSLQACGPGFSAVESQSSNSIGFLDVESVPNSLAVEVQPDGETPNSETAVDLEDQVILLFETHLNKAPTNTQLAAFVNLLNQGVNIESLIIALADEEDTADNTPGTTPASTPAQPTPTSAPQASEPTGQFVAGAVRWSGNRKMSSGTRGGSPIGRAKAEKECGQLIENGGTLRAGNGNYANPDFPNKAEQYICIHAGEVINYKGRVLKYMHNSTRDSLLPEILEALCERETHFACN